jgi:hypothetical protein
MKIETSRILSDFFENKDSSASEFEQWVYSNSELETEIGEHIYSELISLDFKDNSIRIQVKELVDSIIDYAQLHRNEIMAILDKLISQKSNPLDEIRKLFQWAEKGYTFLASTDIIGNFGEQGKSVVHSINNEMSNETQWNKLIEIDSNFINELRSLKERIENNQIVFTGEKEDIKFYGEQFKYIEK